MPEERARYLQPLLLVVRRDQVELMQFVEEAFKLTRGLTIVMDRRHRERRARQDARVAIQRRRRDRRVRTWVGVALAAEGAVVVRV